MLTVLGYLLIIVFLLLVIRQKLSAFTGLIVVSLAAGLIACFLGGIPVEKVLSWIKDGLFYTVNANGKVSLGTINPTIMILFAILYFSLMMNVGLFDPLCTYLIRKAYEFGISPTEIGIASFMGQALRYASPTVAWLFLLMDRTEMSFGDYQKEFFKWSIPMFFIFVITAILTGVLPV